MNGGAACYRIYATAEGRFVSLGAIEPEFWQRFCAAAGRPDWTQRQHEAMPQAALIGEVAALFAGLSLEEAVARFEPADCCFAPALTLAEAVAGPHHRRRGLVRRGGSGLLQALFPPLASSNFPSSSHGESAYHLRGDLPVQVLQINKRIENFCGAADAKIP